MSTALPDASLQLATTLVDALDALAPEPLDFQGEHASGQVRYAPRPERFEEGLRVRGPGEALQRRLLDSTSATKVFLSGHVGSGKSTEIRRLAASEPIQQAFSPVFLAIEEGYRQELDVAQLLFLMAGALFAHGRKVGLLSADNAWRGHLRELDQKVFGEAGVRATEGTTGVELDLFFVKLSQELKLEERRRRQFRELGEVQLTLLLDLLRGLEQDIRKNMILAGTAALRCSSLTISTRCASPPRRTTCFAKGSACSWSRPSGSCTRCRRGSPSIGARRRSVRRGCTSIRSPS
jgi:hypothetical protein